MAIKYDCCEKEGFVVKYSAIRPMVYLDTWALNKFSLNNKLKNRLLRIMKDKGTIAFSILNLYEAVVRDDEEQKKAIYDFMVKVDDIAIESNPFIVIGRENHRNGEKDDFFYSYSWTNQNLLREIGLSGRAFLPLKVAEALYQLVEEIKDSNKQLTTRFETELMPMIVEGRNCEKKLNDSKMKLKRKIQVKETYRPYTKEIYDYFINYLIANENMKMGEGEWIDMFHLIIPMAYCDFVLADKRWTHIIKSTGLKYPNIANVYSPNDIEDFLCELEKF